MGHPPSETLLRELEARLGPRGFTRAPDAIAPLLTDWRGRFSGVSPALLLPASTDEVAAIVRLCANAGTPLVPQGGNSSMVGGATPPDDGSALLVSLRRMDRIRSIDGEANRMVVEAGAILAHVHDAAAAAGRRFPLSLAAKGSATIGGLLSTNAGGTQVLRHGTMRALALGIEAVLPSGDLFDGLAALAKDNRGYDLGGLLIGAEGTLGIITAATLRLTAPLQRRAVAWVGLASPHAALALLRRLQGRAAVESFELLPQAALSLVLAHVPGTRPPLASQHAWHALIEVEEIEGSPELSQLLADAAGEGLVRSAALAASDSQAETLWRLRESVSEAERVDGPAAKHDISVPVAAMPDFLETAGREVEQRFAGARVLAFGHLGDGNIHFNVRAPRDRAQEWMAREADAVTRFVHDRVIGAGGSISAEHGIGQMKLAELGRTGDPVRLAAQSAIKRALDPKNIMNPGKLVPLAPDGSGT